MPQSNSPPSNHSSSESTTPPSEATLADETLVSEVAPPLQRRQKFIQDTTNNNPGQQIAQQSADPSYIHTDYESSAAEDYESYTTTKYENADFALLSYSRTNKVEKLQKLLEAKQKHEVDLNLNFKGQQKQNFSWSALHLACYFGHAKIVETILSEKLFREEIDINIQNNSGDTPLHKATLTNRIGIVQLLLSHGADVFVRNSDGLLAKQLTTDGHILEMLEAAEQVDKNRIRQEVFKAVDSGDLKQLQKYFDNRHSMSQSIQSDQAETAIEQSGDGSQDRYSESNQNFCLSANEMIDQMTDERGNTLLHLAAMRGNKATCIYLLEHGFDPYKKNNSGQTCVDLSSYQLRQLFATVKPTDSQLKKFSRQRVIRFEGPLLKRVRILGWKQIYVVLENGVILLFNNRRDSMNRSRRGYKYLESATCVPELNDLGMFTVCFSDKSRATFLVTSNHLEHYPTFKTTPAEQNKSIPSSQVELIRQKWIDSIRDHIQYSTNFIRNGLKLNDDDENEQGNNEAGLASINHLLPIDTIKSFIHEARAHYSILERHADSLCNLVQSISASDRLTNSMDMQRDAVTRQPEQPATSTPSSGSRLLGFIRPYRQSRDNSIVADDNAPIANQQVGLNETQRKRNASLTSEFVQDNWHCVLFHLRLLMESTENTKSSMGQALALLEHQEQLRQNRIQDQEERCRVLEDSLHALARDHHELEKSLSMSQIYHSATARSMSMSTDLNEYFDAFEDFDDEKTVTPNSSHSEEDLHRKIEEVLNESNENLNLNVMINEVELNPSTSGQFQANDEGEDDEMDDDDIQSNCSALTVETVSGQFLSITDQKKEAESAIDAPNLSTMAVDNNR